MLSGQNTDLFLIMVDEGELGQIVSEAIPKKTRQHTKWCHNTFKSGILIGVFLNPGIWNRIWNEFWNDPDLRYIKGNTLGYMQVK